MFEIHNCLKNGTDIFKKKKTGSVLNWYLSLEIIFLLENQASSTASKQKRCEEHWVEFSVLQKWKSVKRFENYFSIKYRCFSNEKMLKMQLHEKERHSSIDIPFHWRTKLLSNHISALLQWSCSSSLWRALLFANEPAKRKKSFNIFPISEFLFEHFYSFKMISCSNSTYFFLHFSCFSCSISLLLWHLFAFECSVFGFLSAQFALHLHTKMEEKADAFVPIDSICRKTVRSTSPTCINIGITILFLCHLSPGSRNRGSFIRRKINMPYQSRNVYY